MSNQPRDAGESGEGSPDSSDEIRQRELKLWISDQIKRRKRKLWIRHVLGWMIALVFLSLFFLDRTTSAAHGDVEMFVWLSWIVVIVIASAIAGLVYTLRNWEKLGATHTISRSLLMFIFLLEFVAFVLFEARRWGVHIEACRTVGELETCQGQAAPPQVLGMLAWHAANVVPVLDITHSLEWPRPARSANAVVGASILALRLWVAIGILGVLKLLWDKWGPIGSSRKSTDRPPDTHEPGEYRGEEE